MYQKDFVWELEMPLTYGKHQYKFIVDGNWATDNSMETEVDQNGNVNNVIMIFP